MKKLLSSRRLFSLGFLILVATNIVVLSGVVSNKSGEPEAQIILTERELQLPYQVHEENSGLALRLTWRALGKVEDYSTYSDWRTPAWLSAEELEALGFNINNYLSSVGNTTFYKQPIPKEVFIVLEIDGAPYREAVKRATVALQTEKSSFKLNPGDKRLRDNFERAEKRLKREHNEASRLFAIDAGLDASELRDQYGDKNRFLITKGLIEARYYHDKNKKKIFGYISRLSVASIHVPLKHRLIFDSIITQEKSKRNDFKKPRFEVKLAYGSRLEPWIVSVNKMR
jgi:hypothetical protein